MKARENIHDPGFFERYLTIWVIPCIGLGIFLGRLGVLFRGFIGAEATDFVMKKKIIF